MVGLIPLMLKPSPAPASPGLRTHSPASTASFPPVPLTATRKPASTSQTSSSPPKRNVPTAFSLHFRSASTSVLPPASSNRFSQQPARRRRLSTRLSTIAEPEAGTPAMRRVSMPPLPSLPSDPADWAQVLADVKRNFFNRRFRQCAARCNEILNHASKRNATEAVHLIYLRFYAASSLEQMARSLYSNSPARSKLLQQARDQYCAADDLVRDEESSIGRQSRRSSITSYSTYSASSRTTASTALSSPTHSIYGACGPTSPPCSQPLSRAPSFSKKRVTFLNCGDNDDFEPPEPIIRPDSPTLGFDDWISPRNPEPELVAKTPCHEELSQNLHGLLLPQSPPDRYAVLLSDIRVQIASHIAAVDAQLSPSEAPTLSDLPGEDEEMRLMELRVRIERLRSNGWRRPRFDARRYGALCDSVLAEL